MTAGVIGGVYLGYKLIAHDLAVIAVCFLAFAIAAVVTLSVGLIRLFQRDRFALMYLGDPRNVKVTTMAEVRAAVPALPIAMTKAIEAPRSVPANALGIQIEDVISNG
jgi:hypothetical protein